MARSRSGDGDLCPFPLGESCGAMFVLQGTPPSQYCPNQAHDGVWGEGVRTAPTRKHWSLNQFEADVASHKAAVAKAGQVDGPAEGLAPLATAAPLPDLDLGGFDA